MFNIILTGRWGSKMPNNTDNRVILSHDDTKMIDMIYNITNADDTPLCQTLIPMPKSLEGTEAFDENGVSGWYAWRVENWGTKWDIYESNCTRIDANTLAMNFYTAWSPPFPVYDKLTEMGFNVEARYLDEGWMYIGIYDSNGEGVHFDTVEDVVKKCPELDYEFGISEDMEWMRDSGDPHYGDPESREIAQ